MARLYRSLIGTCWVLGLLSTLAGIFLRLVPKVVAKTNLSPRAGLILAGVLFLCVLATREMERRSTSGS
jgi:hypothetical protein